MLKKPAEPSTRMCPGLVGKSWVAASDPWPVISADKSVVVARTPRMVGTMRPAMLSSASINPFSSVVKMATVVSLKRDACSRLPTGVKRTAAITVAAAAAAHGALRRFTNGSRQRGEKSSEVAIGIVQIVHTKHSHSHLHLTMHLHSDCRGSVTRTVCV